MRKPSVIAKCLVMVVLTTFLFSGCSLWGRFFKTEKHEEAPEEVMAKARRSFDKGYYEQASTEFEKIKDRYPYSKFALEAEIKMADSLYRRRQYAEAYGAYDEFEKLHPRNPNVPYVIYQQGMSQLKQASTIDRDQSHVVKARREFERLVKKFPGSEYAAKARSKIRDCYVSLARYELYVGNFYYKQKKYRAAMKRYRYLVEKYPDLGQYHEAIENLGRCRAKLAEMPAPEDSSKKEKASSVSSWLHKLNPFNWWD